MTRRYIQLELTSRYTRAFSREAGLLNRRVVETERAQHERHASPLATRSRLAVAPAPQLGSR